MSYMQTIRKTIEEAEAVLITAGAGMGVGSSLPDFRGNEGSSMFLELVKKKIKTTSFSHSMSRAVSKSGF